MATAGSVPPSSPEGDGGIGPGSSVEGSAGGGGGGSLGGSVVSSAGGSSGVAQVASPGAAIGSLTPAISSSSSNSNPRCEEITIPMCRGIGYNLTAMPNELNHDTQEEAGLEVHQFWPLVEIRCSLDLKFFLCSMYAPICIEDYHKPLPACRSVCERARAGCAPLMQQYGFKWPERMACERLPPYGDPENLCMEQNNRTDSGGGQPPTPPPYRPAAPTRRTGPVRCKPGKAAPPGRGGPGDCACACRPPLVSLSRDSPWYNKSVMVADVPNCAFPCDVAFASNAERKFASAWLALWAGVCCVSTLATVSTFLIDAERFRYPERPIVFLSACYFLVGVGYLVRALLGHDEIACEDVMGTTAMGATSAPGAVLILRHHASGPGACTAVFLLVYFFGMASSIWWVVLALTWFLAAGLKWGNEAIASLAPYFHLAAWLIPAGKAAAALASNAVDSDPVAGICYVGGLNDGNLRVFVLAPLLAYLLIGTSFLLAGFVSLFRIRSVLKRQQQYHQHSQADKLEKLMIRIGVFSVLYTVPATVVIGCHFYEASMRPEWMRQTACPCEGGSGGQHYHQHPTRPLYSVLMLKYFMALAVGITSGVWIWSGKTLDSWRWFWHRITGGRGGGPGGPGGVGGGVGSTGRGGRGRGGYYSQSHLVGGGGGSLLAGHQAPSHHYPSSGHIHGHACMPKQQQQPQRPLTGLKGQQSICGYSSVASPAVPVPGVAASVQSSHVGSVVQQKGVAAPLSHV
ncbi:frizzled-5-like [Hetaerina americana]|uniref:frizzled-5-like n=1 Tax=Hetaerina americana TaxID=62018 RepID=UPI003A7F4CB2